uniref:ORF3 n=1 Tax=Bremia lactucae associated ssRNA 2 TaxID=2719812 RepID=A0A6G9EMX3_9VIRU|nr:MAG: ORF3 [Bremia lactucae associated ssRNA 2]
MKVKGNAHFVRGRERFTFPDGEVKDTTIPTHLWFDTDPSVCYSNESLFSMIGFGTGAYSYALNPDSLIGGASKRLLSIRDNNPTTHVEMATLQGETLRTAGLRRFKQHFVRYHQKVLNYSEKVHEWLNMPHDKKELRLRVSKKYTRKGKLWRDTRSYVDYKSKPGELLAKGKQLRAIGEISDISAFELGPLATDMKHTFCEPFVYRNCVLMFVPGPKEELLQEGLELLLSVKTSYRMAMIIFSDDSCIAVRHRGKMVLINNDISACDASMFSPIFTFAQETLIAADPKVAAVVRNSFKQCRKKIRLVNPHVDKFNAGGEHIDIPIRKGQYVLPSGFAGTTLLNNFAEVFLFVRMADSFRRVPDNIKEHLERAAYKAGFKVKIDICRSIEDLQFLKHSWSFEGDHLVPYVNLGAWVRGFGLIKSQLPAKKGLTLEDRYQSFLGDIVFSRGNWGSHVISDAFKERFPVLNKIDNSKMSEIGAEKRKTGILSHRISSETLCKRYDCDLSQLLDLCDLIRSWKLGTTICHPVLANIMRKDYGYPEPEQQCSNNLPCHPRLPSFTLNRRNKKSLCFNRIESQYRPTRPRV